jgi:hypothetical protein
MEALAAAQDTRVKAQKAQVDRKTIDGPTLLPRAPTTEEEEEAECSCSPQSPGQRMEAEVERICAEVAVDARLYAASQRSYFDVGAPASPHRGALLCEAPLRACLLAIPVLALSPAGQEPLPRPSQCWVAAAACHPLAPRCGGWVFPAAAPAVVAAPGHGEALGCAAGDALRAAAGGGQTAEEDRMQ